MPNAIRFRALAVFAALMLPNPTVGAPVVQPTAPSTSSPVADSQVTAKAEEWFRRLQTGDIDRSQLDAEVNAQLTSDLIRHEAEALTRLGDPTSFVFIRTYPIAQALEYDFLLQFKAARMVELISFDPGGKIAGLGFEFPASSEAKTEIPLL